MRGRLNNEQTAMFCENMGMMYQAGIQTNEAVGLIAQDSDKGIMQQASALVLENLDKSKSFDEALKDSKAFPDYAVHMVRIASQAGRLEATMFALGQYYLERMRFQDRLRSALIYPLILLMLMTCVLLVLTVCVLPVFSNVYRTMATTISTQSAWFAQAAQSISYIAVAIVLVFTVIFLIGACFAYFGKKNKTTSHLLDFTPFTASASYASALSRVCTALATYAASGIDIENSLIAIKEEIGNKKLRRKIDASLKLIDEGKSFAQAAYETKILDPLYARMLINAEQSGAFDKTLAYVADLVGEDADMRLNNAISAIEPVFAGFLTIAVSIALFAIMIPLIGILGGI